MGWKEVQEVYRQSAIKKRSLRNQRDRLTTEITQTWKEGIARLKAENDRLQKERDEWFRNEMQLEAEYVRDALVGAQR